MLPWRTRPRAHLWPRRATLSGSPGRSDARFGAARPFRPRLTRKKDRQIDEIGEREARRGRKGESEGERESERREFINIAWDRWHPEALEDSRLYGRAAYFISSSTTDGRASVDSARLCVTNIITKRKETTFA